MAINYNSNYICEMCGEIESIAGTFKEATDAILSKGWICLRLSSGWHHICRGCGQEVMSFIGSSSSNKPVGARRQKKKPKTSGRTWLRLSLAAFNGYSGANRNSPEEFLGCWKLRKVDDPEALELLRNNYQFALQVARKLIR